MAMIFDKNRNINLGYILTAINNAFFWYAPWLLFLYRYIDIKQATLLQLIGLITRVVTEIPTGAVADLIGKKKTLIVAFFLTAVGETLMSFSSTFGHFVIIYIVIALGYSFYSGTIDAFLYDSLVEHKEEGRYPAILGRSSTIASIATAFATLVGGFLFRYWVGLPFLITGLTKFVGVGISLLVTEPKVDTFVFSTKNFFKQTALGFKHLFRKDMVRYTLLFIILGSYSTVAYEILDDVAVVDWGYTATGISILYTAVIILSIPSGLLYERISRKVKPSVLITGGVLILGVNYLLSPLINVFIWTTIFLIRVVYSPIKKSAVTEMINSNVASNIRVTTLSTYELVIRLPFVIFGVLIGTVMKDIGVKSFSVIFSATLLLLLLIYYVFVFITGVFNKKSRKAIA